jgi:hypothetical protein
MAKVREKRVRTTITARFITSTRRETYPIVKYNNKMLYEKCWKAPLGANGCWPAGVKAGQQPDPTLQASPQCPLPACRA